MVQLQDELVFEQEPFYVSSHTLVFRGTFKGNAVAIKEYLVNQRTEDKTAEVLTEFTRVSSAESSCGPTTLQTCSENLTDIRSVEILQELAALRELHHECILELVGFHDATRKLLVLEFMEHGNLHDYLSGVSSKLILSCSLPRLP